MLEMFGNLGRKFSIWFGQETPGGSAEPSQPERRQWARFPGRGRTSCEQATADSETRTEARIADVGQGGIRLLAARAWAPGTLLHVAVPETARQDAETLLACVVHSEPAADNGWSLGCSFIRELTSRELQALL